MALHVHGVNALERFLQARFYMYDNIYGHRTVRAIDLEMRDVFEETGAENYYQKLTEMIVIIELLPVSFLHQRPPTPQLRGLALYRRLQMF